MIKRCFIDLETTGLSPKRNGVLEIGAVIEYSNVCEEFLFRCRPFEGDVITQAALDVNKLTEEKISSFPSPLKAHGDLVTHLSRHVDRYNKRDKLFFIAYNANFDSQFLREFFKKAGDEYYGSYFWHPFIDVMTMTALRLMNVRHEMSSFHLDDAARRVGIAVDEEKRHGAMYDIELTRKLYYSNLEYFGMER